ncbi:hypothetical protein OPT61_g6459 [Boeremia exigua]|uniref:Uncharacterized protein n=1 Tax=Boeremia exigua TaxID=749465 RepID=A0ACC2I6J9_9PLEO|nr:hypothetical protein OPT61_g6459 [Boeremia exigua]
MPPAKSSTGCAKTARAKPYPASKPANAEVVDLTNKENASPRDSVSPITNQHTAKGKTSSEKNTGATKAHPDLPDNYLDIKQASVIRRKLNALLDKKEKVPGSDKIFNKTILAQQMCEIARAHHPIKSSAGTRAEEPLVRALTAFLKKSGTMGGGDSETYYYGNMLLEKMRIWKGEKKSKAREKLEKEFPKGRARVDPDHFKMFCLPGERPTRAYVANLKR